jgi:putative peptidoglycan lipid II flippase
VPSQALEPGTRLIGRYRLEELLENDGSTGTLSWRAFDETLSRPVNIRTLAAGDDRAALVLAAARASARDQDHRFLRVLDASTDGGVVYVISEWVQGRSLAAALGDGPLPPTEAARVVGEVAAALAAAHEIGLAHLCLLPASVLIADSGQVKVIGLGVDAAIRGIENPTAGEAAIADVRGSGALLYAALTARWPLIGPEAEAGLAPAPQEHGHPCTPGQVRNGIPRDIDAATVRALRAPLAVAGLALPTPGSLADALATHHGSGASTWHGWDHDRRDDERIARAASLAWSEQTDPGLAPPRGLTPLRGRPGRARRALWSVGATLLTVGIGLAGVTMLGLGAGQQDGAARAGAPNVTPVTVETTEPVAGTTGGAALEVVAVTDLDPEADRGDGQENPRQVRNVLDNDLATTWPTRTYLNRPNLGGLKPGVGLVLDLGAVQPVGAVTIRLVGRGTGLELRAADSPGYRGADYDLIVATEGASQLRTIQLRDPLQTRYLLVWLTSLPRVGQDEYRGEISEIVVRR